MTQSNVRPGGVTFVASLCAVAGFLELAIGVLCLIFLPAIIDQGRVSGAYVGWSAVVLMVLGLLYLAVSRGLYRGRDFARVVVLVVSVLHAVNGLWLVLSGQFIGGLVTILIAIAIVSLLWSGRGAEFFARKTLNG